MTTHDATALRISGPAELLAAVPYLLGFRPTSSLVLVGLAASRLVVTARIDLADATDSNVKATIAAMVRAGTTDLIAVIYTDITPTDGMKPHHDVADRVTGLVGNHAALVDLLLVAGERYWSYLCSDPACWDDTGRPMRCTTTPFAAAATYAGISVAASRDALADILTPVRDRNGLAATIGQSVHAMTPIATPGGDLTRQGCDTRAAVFAAAKQIAADPSVDTADLDIARLGAALQHIPIRDAVWLAVDDGEIEGTALWLLLARCLPGPYDAPALFLFAWQSWRAGNGVLAGIAAERALASDPAYTAAELLLMAISAGINPTTMPKLTGARDGGRHDGST